MLPRSKVSKAQGEFELNVHLALRAECDIEMVPKGHVHILDEEHRFTPDIEISK